MLASEQLSGAARKPSPSPRGVGIMPAASGKSSCSRTSSQRRSHGLPEIPMACTTTGRASRARLP
eukprot:9589859-Lingulodinium_polyedra.AAC.1